MSHVHNMLNCCHVPSKTTKLHHHHHHHLHHKFSICNVSSAKFTKVKESKRAGVAVTLLVRASENATPSAAQALSSSSSSSSSEKSQPLISGSDVVRKFYAGINKHDLASVENLIAVNCVYEDLVFPKPFVGRKSILEFFGKFIDQISTDLQFVIDAISEEDSSAVGVTWHLEWKGKAFPFSKGCSFYQLAVSDGIQQIIYARDSVEPAIKPGESALVAIRGVTWLLQRFPNLIDRL